MNITPNAATTQMATFGVWCVGLTLRRNDDQGRPPSRANANSIREPLVTVASPQQNCAAAMPTRRRNRRGAGSTSDIVQKKALPPWAAAAPMSGIAITRAASITQPASAETTTARMIARGTSWAAPTVSSAAWAEASNPVIV